eukprot:6174343-Pleurochrysis_carterae.AAC.1
MKNGLRNSKSGGKGSEQGEQKVTKVWVWGKGSKGAGKGGGKRRMKECTKDRAGGRGKAQKYIRNVTAAGVRGSAPRMDSAKEPSPSTCTMRA